MTQDKPTVREVADNKFFKNNTNNNTTSKKHPKLSKPENFFISISLHSKRKEMMKAIKLAAIINPAPIILR